MKVSAFGSWMSAPNSLFFQDLEGLPEVFDPGRPHEMTPGRPQDIRPENFLLSLWAAFSFLTVSITHHNVRVVVNELLPARRRLL